MILSTGCALPLSPNKVALRSDRRLTLKVFNIQWSTNNKHLLVEQHMDRPLTFCLLPLFLIRSPEVRPLFDPARRPPRPPPTLRRGLPLFGSALSAPSRGQKKSDRSSNVLTNSLSLSLSRFLCFSLSVMKLIIGCPERKRRQVLAEECPVKRKRILPKGSRGIGISTWGFRRLIGLREERGHGQFW